MMRWLALPVTIAASASPALAQRVEVSPYIEAGQVLLADLNDGDVVTYTQLTAGVDATITTQRVQVQANYQYQRLIDWGDDFGNGDVHSGLARANVQITRWLNLEGGAIATRAQGDTRGGGFGPLVNASNVNTAQVYGLYAGPSVNTRVGPFAVNGTYQFGYVKAETPGVVDLAPGQRRLDYYDEATSHLVMGSAGTRAGTLLPIGFTVSGAWLREDAGQLDQKFEGAYGRVDAVLPITPTLAAVGGVGYEKIEVTQRDPLLDAQNIPVVDGAGRFVTDPASAPRIAYDTDGIIWDAGVLWRPSPRTALEARLGRRYGSMSYTGSLQWQVSPASALQVGVYDSVTTFGRQLTGSLSQLPINYIGGEDPFGARYGGCVFGGGVTPEGASNAGGCLTPVFQSVSAATFRARGIDAVYSITRGPTRLGLGAGYASRAYYIPPVPGAVIYRTRDESYYVQGFGQWALDSRSSVSADLYANYFASGIEGGLDAWGGGAQGGYYRSFGRAYGSLTAGVYGFDVERSQSDLIAQALLAVGFRF
ncbi:MULTISPECIES: hypothetical protein [Alphaproteobacteria]|uniref:hypothetical protein n=1 Tax=Alphaproteobacteria TaxID=28211 RepID=UPI0025D395CD|nr:MULTISPECIES: hypothetical protein [Alphaproteobacteria]